MLRDPGYEFLYWKQLKVLLIFALSHGRMVQHLAGMTHFRAGLV